MLYCAFVGPSETFNPATHSREDMEVYTVRLAGNEGDAAELTLEVLNTRTAMPGRRLFFSKDGTLVFTGYVTSFIGQVGQTITVQAVGKPANAQALQDALCQSLKVAPFYDELSLPEASRNDISEVLAGHSRVLDWNRLSNTVSAPDLFLEHLAPVDVAPTAGSLSVSSEEPIAGVEVSCVAKWAQIVDNEEDLAKQGIDGLRTLSAEKIVENFPKPGDEIAPDVVVLESFCSEKTNLAGVALRELYTMVLNKTTGEFSLDPTIEEDDEVAERALLSTLDAKLQIAHRFEARRVETARFTLDRPLQPDVQRGPVEVLEIPLQELKPGETMLLPQWAPATFYELGDFVSYNGATWESQFSHWSQDRFSAIWWRKTGLPAKYSIRRLNTFFGSPRGLEFRDYMLERAKDRLRRSGRCVRVSCDAELPEDLNSIHTGARVRIVAPGLVGGTAVGKVVSYVFNWVNGDGYMSVEIACAPGTGDADSTAILTAENGLRFTPAWGLVEVKIENDAEVQLEQFLEQRPPKPPKSESDEYIWPPTFSTKTVVEREPGDVLPTKITFEAVYVEDDYEGSCDLIVAGDFSLPNGFTS